MITLSDIRNRIETDLDDATLTRMRDAAVQSIERAHGGAAQVVTLRAGGTRDIVLPRPAASVTSVKERRTVTSDEVTLSANDYRSVNDWILVRLATGDNPATAWGHEVAIDFGGVVDAELRDRVTLDLVQMDVEFRAFESEKSGDWSGDQSDYDARRKALLDQVREPDLGFH